MLCLVVIVILLSIPNALNQEEHTADYWDQRGYEFLNKSMFSGPLDNNSLELAEMCFNKAIEINPLDEYAWFCEGVVLDIQGKLNESVKAYDKSTEINPKSEHAWFNLGIGLKKLHRYNEAINAINKGIDLNPNKADFRQLKGLALQAINRSADANAAFAKAKELA